jgi:hypothetical protein
MIEALTRAGRAERQPLPFGTGRFSSRGGGFDEDLDGHQWGEDREAEKEDEGKVDRVGEDWRHCHWVVIKEGSRTRNEFS